MSDPQILADAVRCRLELEREAVNQAVAEMSTLDGGSGLSEKIRVDLRRSGHQWVRISTVHQLSKWCHPKRWADREKRMRPVARNVSCLLFGFVVGRMLEPEDHLGGPVSTKALRGGPLSTRALRDATSVGFSIIWTLLKLFLTSKVGIFALILGIALLWDVSTTSLEESMTREILDSGSGTVPQDIIFFNKFYPKATFTSSVIKNESSSVWFDLSFCTRNGSSVLDLDRLDPGKSVSTYGAYSVRFKGVTSSGDIVSGYKSRFRNPD